MPPIEGHAFSRHWRRPSPGGRPAGWLTHRYGSSGHIRFGRAETEKRASACLAPACCPPMWLQGPPRWVLQGRGGRRGPRSKALLSVQRCDLVSERCPHGGRRTLFSLCRKIELGSCAVGLGLARHRVPSRIAEDTGEEIPEPLLSTLPCFGLDIAPRRILCKLR